MDLGVKPKNTKTSGKRQKKETPTHQDKEDINDEPMHVAADVVIKTEHMETDVVRFNEGKLEECTKEKYPNAYYCLNFTTPTPVPGVSIIFASNIEEARVELATKLVDSGTDPHDIDVKKFTFIQMRNDIKGAYILSDGRDVLK